MGAYAAGRTAHLFPPTYIHPSLIKDEEAAAAYQDNPVHNNNPEDIYQIESL